MNQNKQIFRVLALTIPIILCIGIVGAVKLTEPANMDTLAQNTVLQDGDREDRDSSDPKFVELSRQNGSNSNGDSLFEALNEYDNLFDLKRSLLSLVDTATKHELVEIFNESREYPLAFDSIQTTQWLWSIVLSKLLDIDSDTVQSLIEQLDEQTADVVIYGVMREWNPMFADKAVKFLALFDRGLQRQGLVGLIDGSTPLDRAVFMEMGTKLGYLEDYLSGLLERSQFAQDQYSLDDIATELENTIANRQYLFQSVYQKAASFVLNEGLDSLPSVLELFNEQSADNMSQTVRMFFNGAQSRLVSEISRSNPEMMFEYLVSLGEPFDEALLSVVCEVWFAADPKALWNRLKSQDLRNVQSALAGDVINYWTRREPDLALISLSQFPTEYHDLVYVEIAETVARNYPLEALELLSKTSDWSQTLSDRNESKRSSDRSVRIPYYYSIDETIAAATKTDPISTIEWLESNGSNLDDSMKLYFLDEAFESWAGYDPDTAFEMALQFPLTADRAGLEATVVGTLARYEVDRAIKLLPRVRDGETRLTAYKRVMWGLEAEDRISDALHLGSDLPEQARKEYNESLASQIGDREPFDHLIAGLRALPTQELQSEAIKSRLMFIYLLPEYSPKITNKQLDQLKEFLTNREKKLLERARREFKHLIHDDTEEE